MNTTSDTVILAHHSLLLAIPAFLPAVLVAGVVVFIAMRDRKTDQPPSNSTENPRKDDQA